MSNARTRLSLAHLSVIDASPLQLIDAASVGGFDSIGLRIVAPMPSDKIVPVVGDERLIREIEHRLAATGLDILDVEAVWLGPDTDVKVYEAAFETAARLKAKHFLVVGNDPDESRLIDRFARFSQLAKPFGIKAMLEFIPYCHTRTVEDAHRVVSKAGQANAGVLVDALHLSRSGGNPASLRLLDPTWLSYCQICDARAQPPAADGLRTEARTDRLLPGLGALPLHELLDALPRGMPIGVEAPCAQYAELDVLQRGRLCGVAARAFLRGRLNGA